MFAQIMRGIDIVKAAGIELKILAVVTEHSINRPQEFYDFFVALGCSTLAINIEEIELANKSIDFEAEGVKAFWQGLYNAWSKNPVIRIREFDQILNWVRRTEAKPDEFELTSVNIEPLPTVLWNGDVIWGSPELAGAHIEPYGNFVFGNVRTDNFANLLSRFQEVPYIREYAKGKEMCSKECDYFSYCRGGDLSNKVFENGTPVSTVTKHCTHKFMLPVDVVLDTLIEAG